MDWHKFCSIPVMLPLRIILNFKKEGDLYIALDWVTRGWIKYCIKPTKLRPELDSDEMDFVKSEAKAKRIHVEVNIHYESK